MMDDERYRGNRELDVKINPLVTSKLRRGWMDTRADSRLAQQLEENSTFVLHHTWKTDCVLQSRGDYMKTWFEVEPDVQVWFLRDDTLSGRSGQHTDVLDHTGPIAEAEAYYYYTGRLAEHDALLTVLSLEEFQNYREHHNVPGESTWGRGEGAGACADVRDVYGARVEFPR